MGLFDVSHAGESRHDSARAVRERGIVYDDDLAGSGRERTERGERAGELGRPLVGAYGDGDAGATQQLGVGSLRQREERLLELEGRGERPERRGLPLPWRYRERGVEPLRK